MSQMPEWGKSDPKLVEKFVRAFGDFTFHVALEKRSRELDERIRNAALSLADKIEVFRRLSPKADVTGPREELRMERLLFSIAPQDLTLFKFALEYDGDYKDVAEYVFHDIDDKERQDRIIEHFRTARREIGVKVLTDVDDTMYANFIDERYPKKTLYPGVLEFYDALKREPFELSAIPVTTLSARPNPVAGKLEESSLEGLVEKTHGRLLPSALSGALISSTAGTVESWLRANLDLLPNKVPHGQEDKIGEVKFQNFLHFSMVYPEYRYVFVGDSGQADSLTAQLMVTEKSMEGTSRVITTFIHDLRESKNDEKSGSSTFRNLRPDVLVGKNSAAGRGVIVFRNYIDAAVVAHMHSATLDNLITAEGLAGITRAALEQFHNLKTNFQGKESSRDRLRDEYREDAEEACHLLMKATPGSAALEENVKAIRGVLDSEL
jgi:SHS2 domain-containing protein